MLVLDEVMTGFRVAYGGAQALYGVSPDLSLFGKVIGGGLPVGAYGGRRDLMEQIAPAGPVYQAGTLSGSPLGDGRGLRGAGRAPRRSIAVRRTWSVSATGWSAASSAAAADAGVACAVGRVGSMVTPVRRDRGGALLRRRQARRIASCSGSSTPRWLEAGVLWPPSQFETAFLSTAHTDADVDRTVEVVCRLRSQPIKLISGVREKQVLDWRPIMLSGIGGHLPEIIIVLVVILIIWGPGKLPDVGAAMGRGIREFRKASSDAHDTVVSTTTTPLAQPTQPAQPAQPVPCAGHRAAAALQSRPKRFRTSRQFPADAPACADADRRHVRCREWPTTSGG